MNKILAHAPRSTAAVLIGALALAILSPAMILAQRLAVSAEAARQNLLTLAQGLGVAALLGAAALALDLFHLARRVAGRSRGGAGNGGKR